MKNIKVKTVEAYMTTDDQLFICEMEAEKHQGDILGELLDELLPYDDRGNITRIDRHNILIKMLEGKDLKRIIKQINNTING